MTTLIPNPTVRRLSLDKEVRYSSLAEIDIISTPEEGGDTQTITLNISEMRILLDYITGHLALWEYTEVKDILG